ncbi:SCO family protein [Solirhodobacter olei]|uniref:SCO family protein n=1 Tax=Solirhodobacter olei TaxID=2493082 RepID=UPI0013E31E4D|nr:SCO family protein [Solirhodobacter olei]
MPGQKSRQTRRAALATLGSGLALGLPGVALAERPWNNDNIAGAMGDLSFTLTRAEDGREVTAQDYRGKVTLLYFGYTFCPDICPTTLANVATILESLGKEASDVRFLFVTVDPNRDTLKVLKDYAAAFAPQVVGLRGTANQLARLARRYHTTYSVHPSPDPSEYKVTHSSAIYVFDQKGKIRLLITSLASAKPKIKGTERDLRRLIAQGPGRGFFGWLAGGL